MGAKYRRRLAQGNARLDIAKIDKTINDLAEWLNGYLSELAKRIGVTNTVTNALVDITGEDKVKEVLAKYEAEQLKIDAANAAKQAEFNAKRDELQVGIDQVSTGQRKANQDALKEAITNGDIPSPDET